MDHADPVSYTHLDVYKRQYEKRQLEDLDKQTLMQRMQETTEA